MTNQVIPAQAVEAAVDALVASKLGDHPGINSEEFVEAAIAALEAAAPHIRAQALEDAAGALELQPPKLRAQYVETLRLYAADPWRLTTCPSECAATNHPGAEHGSNE
jgi:hypothetical protein